MIPRRIRHKPVRKEHEDEEDHDRGADGGFDKKQGDGEEYRRVRRPFIDAAPSDPEPGEMPREG